MRQWFTVSQKAHLDIKVLQQLTHLSSSTATYSDYAAVATSLWGGLVKQYAGELASLTQVQGKVEEQKRNVLLGLVIQQLSEKGLRITNARDLYDYLLIDVEVSGVVEISYVKEAISAVQLYIQRCRNHLEQGVSVDEELDQW